MNEKTYTLLNDKELIGIRNDYIDRMLSLYEGKVFDKPFYVKGIEIVLFNPEEHIEQWVDSTLDLLAEKAHMTKDVDVFRPLCIRYNPYGVHFIDNLFGAEVFLDEKTQQWNSRYITTPIGQLSYPDIQNNKVWDQCKRAVKRFVQHKVSLPYFSLPTLSSALNIAVNLYGQEILVALFDEPENAMHDIKIINKVICELHQWYMDNVPEDQFQHSIPTMRTQPPGYGQICGCATQLLSAELYKTFFGPMDEEVLSLHPKGGLIHLCGSHTQHIPTWKSMKAFKNIQLNDKAASHLETYFNGLREDQIIYLRPCPEMPLKQALEITGGKRLVIMGEPRKG